MKLLKDTDENRKIIKEITELNSRIGGLEKIITSKTEGLEKIKL